MPEDSKESKAKKLAAARKKLKEYQAKEKRDVEGVSAEQANQQGVNSDMVATAMSENTTNDTPPPQMDYTISESVPIEESTKVMEEENPYFNVSAPSLNNGNSSIDTIQILIAEKGALSTELNKFRTVCREKELENEELQTQFQMTSRRLDDLQREFLSQQKLAEELKSSNLTLKVQMQETKSKSDDQVDYLEETKKMLAIEKDKNQSLRNELKSTSNELELAKIRINQVSDEASITKDNRVESLTQTQFMYEQQIRDLQAMVQQFTKDKDQANQQYQTYVQHLNTEVTNLNEKNSELTEECSKLQERERQLVEHISGLEKDIQKSMLRQDQLRENQNAEVNGNYVKEIDDLKAKVADLETERYEFQLKIKSQEDRLGTLNQTISDKNGKISELEEHIQNILSERPDSGKLLATMESDKIAASRALTQNDMLKKQLDELELKFVQLTNDKADLVNKLDAEEYANREIRNNFSSFDLQIKNLGEKLHFKDEEMIRLSHENNDLTRRNLVLKQQLDRLQHHEAREHSGRYELAHENGNDSNYSHSDHQDHDHDHDHSHEHDHNNDKEHHHDHHHDHDHNHDHGHNLDHDQNGEHNSEHSECSSGQPGHDHSHSPTNSEKPFVKDRKYSSEPVSPQHYHQHSHHKHRDDEPPTIPTMEALQKLQSRFTKLMVQVADLTEEKQRLEHLVLQLQGETETIGEYIALYQTQRRILKQREYEKAAQLQILLGEREEMREKITTLNKLVSNLGVELPNNLRLSENLANAMESICIEPNVSSSTSNDGEHDTLSPPAIVDEVAMNKRLNSNESKEILVKIQNIITEIKENTKDIPPVNTADHLTCCSGKFEIV